MVAHHPPGSFEPSGSAYVDRLHGRGVELVGGSVVDMAGIVRAKYVPVRRLPAFHQAGMGASPSWSVFTIDGGIAFTPSLNVIGDRRIRIHPEDVRVVADGVGWAPGDLCDQDGEPSAMCGRSILRRISEKAGLTAYVGAELECTLLSPDGGHASTHPWAPYGVRTSLERSDLLVDLLKAAERAGLGIEQLHTEFAPDQLEISLAPDHPVAAADAVVLARILLGRVAAKHGLLVSFSPVPFAGEGGNGAHLHLSLADAEGPLLSGGDGPHGLRREGGAAIAGILDGLPGLLGVYAGSAVSSPRLQPGNWSGATVCWGLENREAAVRLVAATPGSPHGASLELKVVDPSANPYLAVAALLGSALDGIRRGLPLPDEVPGNPVGADLDLPTLPSDQAAAIDALVASPLATQVLGAPVVEGVAAVRRHEVATYADRPLTETTRALRLAWTC
ncbi:glutamine synthetase family protein [Nocardioides sp. KR10-350]|uniref:glutamine synthetase family protein n=1 Tax=Nocardioides cheoyonin TaxID=3156615 RepID=UPI0032B54BE6